MDWTANNCDKCSKTIIPLSKNIDFQCDLEKAITAVSITNEKIPLTVIEKCKEFEPNEI